jgi:hypothetical protein
VQTCPGCHRHLREDARDCPFCGAAPRSPLVRALNTVGGAVTALVLAACYGVAPDKMDDTGDTSATTGRVDADNDGVVASEDCDDDNAQVFPSQTEDCTNGIDDNCDTKVDGDDPTCTSI